MIKSILKVICLLFFTLSVFTLYNLFIPRDNKNLTTAAINKKIRLTESLVEKFTTDYDCEYEISLKLITEKWSPAQLSPNFELTKNRKIIKSRNDAANVSNGSYLVQKLFDAKSGANYELKINKIDKSLIGKTALLAVDVKCAAPSVAMAFAKDYENEIKILSWLIFGIFLLVTIISGIFGFRRNTSR